MKECDGGNPGMALEVGLSLFADGSPCLADLTRSVLFKNCMFLQIAFSQLLVSAYTRCDRDLFAEIIDAHLKDRRKTLGAYSKNLNYTHKLSVTPGNFIIENIV